MTFVETEVFSVIFRLIITPLLAFLFWLYKKQQSEIAELRNRLAIAEQSVAVSKVTVENVKDDIRDIKNGIEKLSEKLIVHWNREK